VTHWTVSNKMDLRAGIGVSILSVPFHVPVSPKEGKFPLIDMRFYYITARRPPIGQLRTQLFICHSGFLFSPRQGHCVPEFLHEHFLAGSSYQLGVDLSQQARIRLEGGRALNGHGIGLHVSKLAKLSIGDPTVIQNPRVVFGNPVPLQFSDIDLAPCLVAGFHSTPDYRFYYSCMTKTPLGTEKDISSSENSIEQMTSHDNDDTNDEYIQTLYKCPDGLYYSERYGFCVAPYIHQFLGIGHQERYLWGGNRLEKSAVMDSQNGLEWNITDVPWIIPQCQKDGRLGIRDPRYYVLCAQGATKLFICPSNTYFNQKTGTCNPIAQCNCWFQAGYFSDPNPHTGIAGQMDIMIHLDRAYLNLLRKISANSIRRVTLGPRGDGRDLTLLARLICFWREMEKLRTLRYTNTSPPNATAAIIPQLTGPGIIHG